MGLAYAPSGTPFRLVWQASLTPLTLPQALTVSADSRSVYVAGAATPANGGPTDAAVEQLDAFHGTFIAGRAITTLQGTATGIAESPDQTTLVVAGIDANTNASFLYPISARGLAVGTPAQLAAAGGQVGPQDVAITPDQAPVAHLAPVSGTAGTAVTLDASSSSVAYGSITNYAWTFGDGQTATSSQPTTTHTYAATGTYSVTVTETDAAGNSVPPAPFVSSTVNGPGTTPYLQANPAATTSTQVTITPPTNTNTGQTNQTTNTGPSKPSLQLQPPLGPPGTIVTITGSGFPTNTQIKVFWSTTTGAFTATTDRHGNLVGQLYILTPDILGPRLALAQGYPDAKAKFLVVPGDAEPGGNTGSYLFRTEGP